MEYSNNCKICESELLSKDDFHYEYKIYNCAYCCNYGYVLKNNKLDYEFINKFKTNYKILLFNDKTSKMYDYFLDDFTMQLNLHRLNIFR